MKHLTVLFTLCLALGLAPVFASTPPAKPGHLLMRSKLINQQDLRLTLANLEKQYTEVRLVALQGDKIYLRERIKAHNGYSMLIDLSGLEEGRYLLEVYQADESASQVVLVEDGYILLSKVSEPTS